MSEGGTLVAARLPLAYGVLARARLVFLGHEIAGKRRRDPIPRLNCGCIATVPWDC